MSNVSTAAQGGHLYFIGVGPGAPDLLTLRAVRILSTADVIVAPRSAASDSSLALDVVRPHLHAEQEVLEHTYPMARDPQQTSQCWAQMASLCADRLLRGQSVAHITLGDPLVYSTCAYLSQEIAGKVDPDRIHFVSGITALQGASARLGQMLLTQNDRLVLLPADDLAAVAAAFAHCETLAIYKIGKRIGALIELLREHGLLASASMVSYAEQPEERVFQRLDKVDDVQAGYMSVVIVRIGHRGWK